MDRPQRGVERVHGLDLGDGLLELRPVRPRLARRARLRMRREPVLEALDAAVLADQMMQRRAARADEAEDHDGTADVRREARAVLLQPALRTKPCRQQLHEVGASRGAARVVEARLLVVRAEHDAERLAIRGVAEVVEPGRARGLLVEGVLGIGEALRHRRQAIAAKSMTTGSPRPSQAAAATMPSENIWRSIGVASRSSM